MADWAAWQGHLIDGAALVGSALAVAGYQIQLVRRGRWDPGGTVRGLNRVAREAWVRRVMEHKLDILAVQTLRNATMAASLMASTAVLLIFGILNLVANQDRLGEVFSALDPTGAPDPAMVSLKVMLLLVAYFVAFFAYSLAIRNYNHASWLVNVPPDAGGVTPQRVTLILERAALYYSVGTRSYLLTVPLILWLFGPLPLVLATVAVLALLRHLDRFSE